MNIDDLTIKEAKELANLFSKTNTVEARVNNYFINKKVIIRTYAAGIFYGELIEKEGNEVILKKARRLYFWKTLNRGLSLSEVAMGGLHSDSRVCQAVDLVWLEAIEIIPCSEEAVKNIEAHHDYKA